MQARKVVENQLAKALEPVLQDLYLQLKQDIYELNAKAMGERALRAAALNWLAIANPSSANELCLSHYQKATNMTDKLAALEAANNNSLNCRDELMADFYQTWQHDGLVMDKWLALQGKWNSENCLANLNQVEQLTVFTLNNPNRARALISAFSAMNHEQFHALDGSGYSWLADKIKQLNAINPQVAARLVSPLTQWQRFAPTYGKLMKEQLKAIQAVANLSNDLAELIAKSLAQK